MKAWSQMLQSAPTLAPGSTWAKAHTRVPGADVVALAQRLAGGRTTPSARVGHAPTALAQHLGHPLLLRLGDARDTSAATGSARPAARRPGTPPGPSPRSANAPVRCTGSGSGCRRRCRSACSVGEHVVAVGRPARRRGARRARCRRAPPGSVTGSTSAEQLGVAVGGGSALLVPVRRAGAAWPAARPPASCRAGS